MEDNKGLVKTLRSIKSRSKRTLLKTAADTIEALEAEIARLTRPDCGDCKWRGVRPQKCSTCARNAHMKDNYEV